MEGRGEDGGEGGGRRGKGGERREEGRGGNGVYCSTFVFVLGGRRTMQIEHAALEAACGLTKVAACKASGQSSRFHT